MVKLIPYKDQNIYGIKTKHEIMDNGEIRFRLMGKDGSGYIRTEAGKNGAWQNSHYHKYIKEMYIIQKGWLAYAILADGILKQKIYYPEEFFVVESGMIHNIYLPAGAITHTIKYGNTSIFDWYASSELDILTKQIDEEGILEISKNK